MIPVDLYVNPISNAKERINKFAFVVRINKAVNQVIQKRGRCIQSQQKTHSSQTTPFSDVSIPGNVVDNAFGRLGPFYR